MALVEQLFRNTPVDQRWGIKHLCFGLECLVRFRFLPVYGRGVVSSPGRCDLVSARFCQHDGNPVDRDHRSAQSGLEPAGVLSRRMVLHSTTLFSAGLYMLLMALVGYYIKLYGGEWGGVLRIAFLFGAVVVLVALLFFRTVSRPYQVFSTNISSATVTTTARVAAGHWPARREAG